MTARRVLGLGCLLLAACGRSARAPSLANTSTGDASPMEAARAAQRGQGGPRDYARAAAIYTRLCDDGRGELTACFALLDAVEMARGVAFSHQRVLDLQRLLCDRGDPVSCAKNAWWAMFSPDVTGAVALDFSERDKQEQRAAEACEAGDGRACEWQGGQFMRDGDNSEERRRRAYGTACTQDQLYSCGQLAIELQTCDEAEIEDVAACEARALARQLASGRDADRLDAVARLDQACRAGDATACDLVPSRRLSPEGLCRAHDYRACSEVGCLGDEAADAAARAHGVEADSSCARPMGRALAAWRLAPPGPGRSRFPPVVADRRKLRGAQPMPPFEAVKFALHGGRDRHDWPRFDVYNVGDRAVTELGVCLYAYGAADAHGRAQLARVTATLPSLGLASDSRRLLALEDAVTTALPDGTEEVLVTYEHVRFAGDSKAYADATQCPAQLPFDQRITTMWW